jgi:hypothetical protein
MLTSLVLMRRVRLLPLLQHVLITRLEACLAWEITQQRQPEGTSVVAIYQIWLRTVIASRNPALFISSIVT